MRVFKLYINFKHFLSISLLIHLGLLFIIADITNEFDYKVFQKNIQIPKFNVESIRTAGAKEGSKKEIVYVKKQNKNQRALPKKVKQTLSARSLAPPPSKPRVPTCLIFLYQHGKRALAARRALQKSPTSSIKEPYISRKRTLAQPKELYERALLTSHLLQVPTFTISL